MEVGKAFTVHVALITFRLGRESLYTIHDFHCLDKFIIGLSFRCIKHIVMHNSTVFI